MKLRLRTSDDPETAAFDLAGVGMAVGTRTAPSLLDCYPIDSRLGA